MSRREYHRSNSQRRLQNHPVENKKVHGEVNRSIFIENGFAEIWNEFTRKEKWISKVAKHTEKLNSDIQSLNGMALKTPRISLLNIDKALEAKSATYALQALADFDFDALEKRQAEYSRKLHSLPKKYRKQHPLIRLEESYRWLREESVSPHFEDVLFLFGELGSGRTRTAVEAMSSTESMTISISPNANSRLLDQIKNKLPDCRNGRYNSKKEFKTGTNDSIDVINIHIDEVGETTHAPDDLYEELADCLEHMEKFGSVNWLLTGDEAFLGLQNSVAGARFGSRHGYYGKRKSSFSRSVGYWRNLSLMNLSHSTGLHIIEQRNRAIFESIEAELRAGNNRIETQPDYISSPLGAWLLIETASENSLDNQRAEFANNLVYSNYRWKAISENSASRGIDLELWNQISNSLVQSLNETLACEFNFELSGDHNLAKLQRECLRHLESAGAISMTWHANHCSISPRLLHLWSYLLAELLVFNNLSGVAERDNCRSISDWIAATHDGSYIGLQVCHFALAIEAQNDPSSTARKSLWGQWTTVFNGPAAPLLLATSTVGEYGVKYVRRFMATRKDPLSGSFDLYAYIRLLARPGVDGWPPSERLGVFRDLWVEVAVNNLEEYFCVSASRLLRQQLDSKINRGELSRLLAALNGCEKANIADKLAHLFVSGLLESDYFGWQLDVVMAEYARASCEYFRRTQRSLETIDGTFFYCFIKQCVAALADQEYIDSYVLLAEQGWFNNHGADRPRLMHRAMLSLVHKQLGANYRFGKLNKRELVDFVRKLSEGKATKCVHKRQQEESAFFIIRHSGFQNMDNETAKQDDLYSVAEELLQRPSLVSRLPHSDLRALTHCGLYIADRQRKRWSERTNWARPK